MKLIKHIAATTALLVSLGLAAGCTPQRKPLPPTPGNPPSVTQPNPNTNLNNYGVRSRNNLNLYKRTPFGMQGRINKRVAPGAMFGASSLSRTNNLATSIAKRITRNPFVDNATVVILGRTAYIALDLKNNVNANRAAVVKKSVTNIAKRGTPAVNSVVVLTDPDSLTRLKRIASGIASGSPISTFTRELSDIGRRLTPSIK